MFGRPRYRKTKVASFIKGLVQLRGTFSKTKSRPSRLSASIKLGPWSRSTTGREQISFWGFQIPIRRQKKDGNSKDQRHQL